VPTLPTLEVGSVIKHLEWLRLKRLHDITGSESVGITHQVGNWTLREKYQLEIDQITNALAILDGYPYIARQALKVIEGKAQV